MPVCAGLNCYVCSSGMPDCNDPFNATAYNVTTLSLTTNINLSILICIYLQSSLIFRKDLFKN